MLVECVVVEPNTYLGTMYVIVVIERLSHEAVALIFFDCPQLQMQLMLLSHNNTPSFQTRKAFTQSCS